MNLVTLFCAICIFFLRHLVRPAYQEKQEYSMWHKIKVEHKFYLVLEDKLLLWRYINLRRASALERMLLSIISQDKKYQC